MTFSESNVHDIWWNTRHRGKALSKCCANLQTLQDVWLYISRVYGFRGSVGKLAAPSVATTTRQQYCQSVLTEEHVHIHSYLVFTSPDMDSTQNPLIFPIMRKGPSAFSFVMNLWTLSAGWPPFQSKNIPPEPNGDLFWSHCPVSVPYISIVTEV